MIKDQTKESFTPQRSTKTIRARIALALSKKEEKNETADERWGVVNGQSMLARSIDSFFFDVRVFASFTRRSLLKRQDVPQKNEKSQIRLREI
jgi:hypothetical protein